MTVTTLATIKHEIATDDNGNETCCTSAKKSGTADYTESLLENLTPDLSEKDEDKGKTRNEEIHDDIYYEKARTLLQFEDAPDYMKHNPYIRTGYRRILSTNLCLESIFWWTNETINIWSHIFGLMLFISLIAYDFCTLKVQATLSDKIIVFVFMCCFVACMTMSALYHTFMCRSEKDCNTFLSYDLFGIALSLLAIYTSGIYYAFWCDTYWQMFYTMTVTVIFVFAMTLQIPSLNVNSNIKMLVFAAWGAYGVIPTIHWTFHMGGLENPVVSLLLPRVLGMYLISATAFLIYITKIPERFSAGQFDYIGHSHQWWHFFVVLALYYWHNSGIVYIEYRLNHACPNKMKFA